MPYRQTEGIIKATGKSLPDHPSYSQICRRVNKLDISTKRSDDHEDSIVIAIYNTGIKVTNRSQWMQEKWHIKKKKKGHLKIHIAVNTKTKEILTLEVTDGKVHDGKVMPRLIEHVLKRKDNKDSKIKSVLGDGSYDSNENFKDLQTKRIMPGIKVRNNSIKSTKNNKIRNREVGIQTKEISSNGKRKKIWTEMDC